MIPFMQITKTYKIIAAIIIIFLLAYAISALIKRPKPSVPLETNDASVVTNADEIPQTLKDALGPGSYTIKRIPIENKTNTVPIPNLSRPVSFETSTSLSVEVKEIIKNKVAALQVDLKKDPTALDKWIELGLYQKMAGDYEGAVISWEYVSKVADKDYISFGNLGNVYAYYFKDIVKAEQYYNQAIKNSPTQIYLYFQLAESFRDVSKDITKARAVVDRGLAANPGNTELLALKDSLR